MRCDRCVLHSLLARFPFFRCRISAWYPHFFVHFLLSGTLILKWEGIGVVGGGGGGVVVQRGRGDEEGVGVGIQEPVVFLVRYLFSACPCALLAVISTVIYCRVDPGNVIPSSALRRVLNVPGLLACGYCLRIDQSKHGTYFFRSWFLPFFSFLLLKFINHGEEKVFSSKARMQGAKQHRDNNKHLRKNSERCVRPRCVLYVWREAPQAVKSPVAVGGFAKLSISWAVSEGLASDTDPGSWKLDVFMYACTYTLCASFAMLY